jgi:hypothetical protein
MAMNFTFKIFLFSLILSLQAKAQFFSFSPFKNIEVRQLGEIINNPWSGSYNSGQFWPCDLNNDGENDLLVYDKNTNRVLTFIAELSNGSLVWKHNSDYEDLIPEMENWMATADFNCDGKLDLFTGTAIGIKVFKNISSNNIPVAFSLEVDGLYSQGFSGQINIQVNAYGAPAFTDVDSDGDLDILTFDFSGNTVEYHKNLSVENTGQCAGLQFEKQPCVFGLFATKPICGQIKLNTGCQGQMPARPKEHIASPERIQHLGSQLSAMDLDGDGDKDLLVGDLSCPLLNRLINGGTPQNALISSADTLFPSATGYVKINNFPSAYQMDLNFDGKNDIVVTPTYFDNASENYIVNSAKNTYAYYNQSNTQVPAFELGEKDFLQNQSIEVGDEAAPTFADIDADGDMDLFVGNFGLRNGALIQAKVSFYRNTGNQFVPKFSLENEDYLGLSGLFKKRMRPIFEDFNNDGAIDFAWISSPGGFSDSTSMDILINQSAAGQPFSFPVLNQALRFPFVFSPYDCPVFTDVDGDLKKDMLIGKFNGRIQYWKQLTEWPNLQYQSVNSNYGTLNRAPGQNANISIGDIDKDGNLDLVVGNNSGKVKIFRNFKTNTSNIFTADSTWYQNQVLNQSVFRRWGEFLSPALADLNGDTFPELAFGNLGGGISLMVNRLGANLVALEVNEPNWALFPNPGKGGEKLYWKGKSPEILQIFNAQGKQIQSWKSLTFQNEKSIVLPKVGAGIYFIKMADGNHHKTFPFQIVD